MASAAAAPAPTQTSRTKPIPAALVPAALVLGAVVAVLSLLPSVAQAVWELPHLLLLGLVVTYGVFAQHKNSGDAAAKDDGARAWSSRHHPDDPLVVVTPGHAAGDDGEDGASVRPFSLPVRRLKPVVEESEASDGGIGEETDSSASTAGFWAGEQPAAPSPPSVLDASDSREFTAATPPSTKGFPGYDSPSPRDQSSCNEDEEEEDDEGTDWDEDADGSEEMTAPSSERSFPGDFVACRNRPYDGAGDGDGESVDEELIELATQAAPEGVDEVDRKADEFIAKFREQIRLQRSRPRVT
ncbi:hypothetical protein ACQ4PT_022564 [Festuca glaucescens]